MRPELPKRSRRPVWKRLRGALVALVAILVSPLALSDLPQTIEKIRPSVVGIGTFQASRNPKTEFRGTGFVVGDGTMVVTNGHVLPAFLDVEKKETLVVLVGRGPKAQQREAQKLIQDVNHDLVLLRITGEPIPPLSVGDSRTVREGETLAFTGFPIGTILGLYPVTHRATVSSLTPIVIPKIKSRELDVRVLNRLRDPFEVFQLDGTAYPGNSGSPLYYPDTGLVVGVVNMVFVKESKENAIEDPSGIAYAIPSSYLTDLLARAKSKE